MVGEDKPESRRTDAADAPADEETLAEEATGPFVVGVGASAGGLEAIGTLIKDIRLDGMAIVIVQHLAPKHESVLPALLSRSSHLQVLTVHDGMEVEANHIYVIPPNADMAMAHGVLHLTPPGSGHGPRLPIDFFLRSLAEDQGARAIGVILSGTGTDGTFGLKAIKAAGGVTFVQDPVTAKYDGMPRSAVDSADFCLAPERIAEELLRIAKHPQNARAGVPPSQLRENIRKILIQIRAAVGNDLTYYKPSTIERRIERRMALHKIENLDDYVKLVQRNAEELRTLYKDMLISVTSFFRDQAPFEALTRDILPRMIEQKGGVAPIRIWCPACSTGEEAYSIAISLLEFLGDAAQDYRIQIFGTDVDETSIQKSRRGVYPENIALDISPERLQRFFVRRDADYQVIRRIRDMVVFSVQNVTRDPPFSRLDLVSCRNLLIYLQPEMQKKVVRIFHYALAPSGFLLLGTSETVGDTSDLFSLVDRKNKIYAKKQVAPLLADFGMGIHAAYSFPAIQPGAPQRPIMNMATLADRKILDLYGPPGVVVNENYEILHFRGRTGPYLEPAPGAASLGILRLARPDFHVELRRALHQAHKDNTRTLVDCHVTDRGMLRKFKLEVVPIADPETKTRAMLVLFHEPPAPHDEPHDGGPEPEKGPPSPEDQQMQELERELLFTKEFLQSTVEELESANEELMSSNEELQSSNEELQSTNEELETSKEELQSTNEELTTVNDELQSRMAELQQSNDDLHNVLTGVGNAVVIIGMDLRIRRFTHAAEGLLNLLPCDVGRSVNVVNTFVTGARVDELAARVIEKLTPVEQEVLCSDQRWYELHITPYKTLEHAIKGAVIVLIDIDVRKRAAEMGRDVAEYAGKFLELIGNPLLIVDGKLRVVWANDAFYRTFQVVDQETIGAPLAKLGTGQWADAKLTRLLEGTIATGSAFRNCSLDASLPDVGPKVIRISGSRIPPMGGEPILILLSFEEDSVPRGG